MKKIIFVSLSFIGLLFTSCETLDLARLSSLTDSGGLSTNTIIAGLKEALNKGTDQAVDQLSQKGGFSRNSLFRIKLPQQLTDVKSTMKKLGLGFMVDSFENKMNEAAEQASKSAGPVFVDAIKQMTFADAKEILNGSDTAATDYLKKTTSKKLLELYKPIVTKNMEEVGVAQAYNKLISKYDALPFKSKPKLSLEEYITSKALHAMFSVLAEEEKKIRQDPTARTTELLQKVFGE